MEIKIAENDAGQRLDRFLRKAFKATPLSLIHKSLRKGKVRVNGKRGKAEQMLEIGDTLNARDIALRRIVSVNEQVKEFSIDLTPMILYEDERFIVVNKPVGLPVHSGAFHHGDTLIDLIKQHVGRNADSFTFEPALAHRIDKGVSGAVLAAKSADALRKATELFRLSQVKKEYFALVGTAPFADSGVIETPLEDKSGKFLESKTAWKVIERRGEGALLRVRLYTGRMHQIRRHLSGENMAIIGDTEYGGKQAFRIMLHSALIEFTDSFTNKKISVEAPMPEEMALAAYRK